jgi:hypothetical protein
MSQEIPPDYADYEVLLQLARNAGEMLAKTWIPRLCDQLRKENPEMPNEDIKETVTKDCKDIWSKATIRDNIPDEYKDPKKQEAGRKGREKQLEAPIPAGSARTVRAENSSVSQTEQESESFENADTEFVQAPENLEKVPEIVDDKIGPIKMQNLSRVSDFDRRGYQILAGRYTEIIKKKLENDGNARINFYVVARDRTTGIESLVPIKFVIDLDSRKAEVILNEDML